jgi:hypothetical protein
MFQLRPKCYFLRRWETPIHRVAKTILLRLGLSTRRGPVVGVPKMNEDLRIVYFEIYARLMLGLAGNDATTRGIGALLSS